MIKPGHWVVFLRQNTLSSKCLSPPRSINGDLSGKPYEIPEENIAMD